MEGAITKLKIQLLVIESLDGKSKPLDVTNSVSQIDYFENILEPSVTMKIDLFNVYSIFNELPIRGGERVSLKFLTASGVLDFTGVRSLYVYKVSDIDASKQRELLTLHLVSPEYFGNETSQCSRKYAKKNIKEHVEDILKNTLKTKKRCDVEKTQNPYTFIGNNRKPFHVINWLGPKSVSAVPGTKGTSGGDGSRSGEAKGTAGFLFYENFDGYNFKSIDSLVSDTRVGLQSADKKDPTVYFYTQVIETTQELNNFKIIKYNFEKNIDVRKSLRTGMYSNYTFFYDIITNRFSLYKYDLKEEIKKSPQLGKQEEIVVSDMYGGKPSRTLVRVSDHGTLEVGTGDAPSGRDNADMAKSYSRYNLLFTQSLNILVPLNTSLRVGDIVKCRFPRLKQGKSVEVDREMSGHYLIRELRHHFEANKNTTSLKLMRDSYGLYGPNE